MTNKVYVILHNYQIPHEPTSDSCNVGVCDSLTEVEKAIRKYMERAELYKDIKITLPCKCLCPKETGINEINKVIKILIKELKILNCEELHEFFKFFYKLNQTHCKMYYF